MRLISNEQAKTNKEVHADYKRTERFLKDYPSQIEFLEKSGGWCNVSKKRKRCLALATILTVVGVVVGSLSYLVLKDTVERQEQGTEILADLGYYPANHNHKIEEQMRLLQERESGKTSDEAFSQEMKEIPDLDPYAYVRTYGTEEQIHDFDRSGYNETAGAWAICTILFASCLTAAEGLAIATQTPSEAQAYFSNNDAMSFITGKGPHPIDGSRCIED